MWKGVFIRCIVVDADKYTLESALYKSVACGKNIILFIDDVQQINESVWAFFICGINSKERGPPRVLHFKNFTKWRTHGCQNGYE